VLTVRVPICARLCVVALGCTLVVGHWWARDLVLTGMGTKVPDTGLGSLRVGPNVEATPWPRSGGIKAPGTSDGSPISR
jgi:hypothetical protein